MSYLMKNLESLGDLLLAGLMILFFLLVTILVISAAFIAVGR
jgi:hypothetical protein